MFYLKRIVVLVFFSFIISGCSSVYTSSQWKAMKEIEVRSADNQLENIQTQKNISLDSLIKEALLSNKELKSFFLMWKTDLLKVVSADSLPDPFFSYSHYVESVETRVGPQEQSFQLTQQFPFFWKRSNRKQKALSKASQSQERYNSAKLKVIYEVKEAYYEYVYLNQAVRITDTNAKLLNHFEKVIQAGYKSGKAANQDLLKIQVSLALLADEKIALQDMAEAVLVKLNAAVGLPLGLNLNIELDNNLPEVDIRNLNLDMLVDNMLKSNPRLKEISHKIEESECDIRLARLRFFPDVTVGGTYIDTADSEIVVPDSGKDPAIVMVKVNLPVWYRSLNSSLLSVKQRYMSQKNLLKDMKAKMQAQATVVFYKLKDADRKINLYDKALIPKANQILKTTESAYKSGEVDFLSLIDAQRSILDMELKSAKAKADFLKQSAKLKRLTGTDLK